MTNLPVFDEHGTPVELTVDGLIAETDALKAEIRMIEKQRDDAVGQLAEKDARIAYLIRTERMNDAVIREQLKIIYSLRLEIANLTGKGGERNGT